MRIKPVVVTLQDTKHLSFINPVFMSGEIPDALIEGFIAVVLKGDPAAAWYTWDIPTQGFSDFTGFTVIASKDKPADIDEMRKNLGRMLGMDQWTQLYQRMTVRALDRDPNEGPAFIKSRYFGTASKPGECHELTFHKPLSPGIKLTIPDILKDSIQVALLRNVTLLKRARGKSPPAMDVEELGLLTYDMAGQPTYTKARRSGKGWAQDINSIDPNLFIGSDSEKRLAALSASFNKLRPLFPAAVPHALEAKRHLPPMAGEPFPVTWLLD